MPGMNGAVDRLALVWRTAEWHLELIDGAPVAPEVRAFAVEVVDAAMSLGPPERLLARTFEVLHHLAQRDDPLFGELLIALPCTGTAAMGASLLRLGERVVAEGTRSTVESMVSTALAFRVVVPSTWMERLVELTPDGELAEDLVYILHSWATDETTDPTAIGALLAQHEALRLAYARFCDDLRELMAADTRSNGASAGPPPA